MKPRTLKILYWVVLILFSAAMFLDAIGGLTKQEAGKEALRHLGYPEYLLVITGAAKLIGVIAILQNTFLVIKEWAFAGFAINFIGAFWSRLAVGDGIALLVPPVVILAIMLFLYFLWKKHERLRVYNDLPI